MLGQCIFTPIAQLSVPWLIDIQFMVQIPVLMVRL